MSKTKHYVRALFLTAMILGLILGSIHLLMNSLGIPQHNAAIENHFTNGNKIKCRYNKRFKEEILSKENAAFDRGVYFITNQKKVRRLVYNPGDCKIIEGK